jgi:hypothetical protein
LDGADLRGDVLGRLGGLARQGLEGFTLSNHGKKGLKTGLKAREDGHPT